MVELFCHTSTNPLTINPNKISNTTQDGRFYTPEITVTDFQADTSDGPIRQIVERINQTTVRSIHSSNRTWSLSISLFGKEFHHTRNYSVGSVYLPLMFLEKQPLWLILLNLLN